MVKGLEGKMYEEQLRSLGLFSPSSAEQAEGRPHGSLQLPHKGSRGAGAELCSLGTAWSWDRGGSGWVLGKGSSSRSGQALGQAPQGSRHGTELLEFKNHLDNTPRHRVCFQGGSVQSPPACPVGAVTKLPCPKPGPTAAGAGPRAASSTLRPRL